MNQVDMHTHSENSTDASDSVVQMCEGASAGGLSGFAVTDHCEVETYGADRYEAALRQSYFDVCRAREIFRGQMELLFGVELGFSKLDAATAEQVVGAYPYDVVLGSLHNMPGRPDFFFLEYDHIDCDALFAAYLDELYEMVCWGKFDVLTHITYPLRYINGVHGGNVRTENHRDRFCRIFERIISKKIALELNTSGLRQQYGKTMPDDDLLRLYRQMGGEMITIGSDAHTAGDVGSHFAAGAEAAKLAGFGGYTAYRKREPIFIKF